MKKILMFTMASCPYCAAASRWMDRLRAEDPAYRELEIEIVDEVLHPDVANAYDYYYVPAYYMDGKKQHEGAASLEAIRRVFDAALER